MNGIKCLILAALLLFFETVQLGQKKSTLAIAVLRPQSHSNKRIRKVVLPAGSYVRGYSSQTGLHVVFRVL